MTRILNRCISGINS